MKKLLMVGLLSYGFVCNGTIANSADYTVPGTHSTISDAISTSNGVAGDNTLTIGDNQTISAAVAGITQNLAISGNNTITPWTVNLNGAHRFSFATAGNTYSVAYLALKGATGSAINTAAGTTTTINNVTFDTNVIAGAINGGAILNAGTININDSIFNSNQTTTADGAAIYNSGTATIKDSSFTSNVAGNRGGAIYNQGAGTLNIDGTNFTSNSATNLGGAILNNKTLNITNGATFSTNSANLGGAIYNGSSSSTLGATSAAFISNIATVGGAIYNIAGATATINTSNFTGNKATTGTGGAIYNVGTATISGSIFDSNVATTNGGSIHNNAGSLTLNAGNVFKNTSNVNNAIDGGAIYHSGAINQLNIDNNTFTAMKASNSGGAVYNYYGKVAISGSTFDSNSALISGGAIYNEGGTLTLSAGNVFKNTTNLANAKTGGAIYNSGSSANLTIDNNTFTGMKVSSSGGAIYSGNSITTISNSTFDSNVATSNGGAISNLGTLNLNAGNVF